MPKRLAVCVALLLSGAAALAAVAPEPSVRFGHLVLHDPSSRIGITAERPEEIPGFGETAAAWQAFGAEDDQQWSVHVDRRSGAPLLVQGSGIRWLPPGEVGSLETLEAHAREFLDAHRLLLRVDPLELRLDREASRPAGPDLWVLVFDRVVNGLPVEGQRFRMYVKYGKLLSFGAERWGSPSSVPAARLTQAEAFESLRRYMGLESHETARHLEEPRLVLQPLPAREAGIETVGRYRGPVGRGVDYRPAFRFVLAVDDDPGFWVGKVDAVSAEILAFYDNVRHARAMGGVFPITNDGTCPEGCEQPGLPLPYADVSIDGAPAVVASDTGLFQCAPAGGTAVTNLQSQFVQITDTCGAVSESTTCDADLDLGTSTGTDCVVPAGSSAGNTHAARTNFYHLNRVKEKARHYLPGNTWVDGQLNSNVNIDNNCNAVWNGSVNFYTSGGGCRNTGEIGGVVHHEYGHGLDQNDGGGFDNTSEAYADVVAILQERISCVGPGFFETGTCSGYGDTCLTCTGIRDMDWDARQRHTPATPANFTQPECGGGGGPCGRETHCESYVISEAIYDLATRDLPAAGLDPDSAWQLAERLWYGSRQGSGGPIINCTLPNADSCNVGSWFNQMRMVDDDDGDLSNGTRHGAAIHAAFARHGIACGDAADPENQSLSSCPNLEAPNLTAEPVNGAVALHWDPVPGAAEYLVLRTELGCAYSQNVIASVAAPSTDFTDDGLPNGLSESYRVQARGSNATCHSPVSTCVTTAAAALSAAGSITLDRAQYACATTLTLTVSDANVGAASVVATVESSTEPAPESVTLFENAPGSGQYVGSIATTDAPAVGGDGLLSLTDGDTITARYVDADDGLGGTGIERSATAGADCNGPAISGVQQTAIDDSGANVLWTTDQASTSVVHYGDVPPPGQTSGSASLVVSHDVRLGGLRACTAYSYSVESEDAAGNRVTDDNAGALYSFETLGRFSDGVRHCHRGELTLEEAVIGCSASLPARLVDIDLNLDPLVAETVVLPVSSTSELDAETITLTETGPNTSVFAGSIPTGPGAPVAGDGVLQAADGDLLTVSYHDADDGSGQAADQAVTADADCSHTGIFGLQVVNVTDESAVVQWSTSEPSTSRLDWGETAALGNVATLDTPGTSHAFTVSPIPECGRFHFRASATDLHGNTDVADADGQPFAANVAEIGGAVYRDEFDTNAGWTLQGEWEIAAPQGLGTGNGDPTSALDGTQVLGHDLSGQGANPGNFELTNESATSPPFDLSALTSVELRFRRWLNTASCCTSSLELHDGTSWSEVWSGFAGDSTWTSQTFDISALAAGKPAVLVRFRQSARFLFGQTAAGWNVDRFIVRDGSQPEFLACGGCTGSPGFGGLTAAVDLDPCGDTGVQLSWDAAPAWGSGNGGTYAVYRSSDPSFVPSPANLLASGVSGTSYVDDTAPNDATQYYVVRAENDETCGGGPNNGGVLDGNLARLAASDDTSQPAAGSVGDSARVRSVLGAHVRLSWSAAPDAFEYAVERSDSPQGPFVEIGRAAGTVFEDRDEWVSGSSRYYRVLAADACGNLTP